MKAKRFLAAIASLGMAVSLMAAMPLSAYADTVYTTIEGAKVTSFDKYLVMESDAVVPSAGFSFTISSGEAVAAAADGTSLPVFAGVGKPKFVLKDADGAANDNDGTARSAVVNFSAEDTDKPTVTIAEKDKGTIKTVRFKTPSNTTDEKYAQKKIQVDFSEVKFTEPGIYRYIITEQNEGANQASGVSNDTDNTRVLDVVVADSSAGGTNKLEITNYLLHDNASDTPKKGTGDASGTATIANKSTGFTNNYETYDLEFSKAVSGNQGSRDKYFKFDISVSDAKGAEITVSGQGTTFLANPQKSTSTSYTEADMNEANAVDGDADREGQQLKADADGNITASFYIKHGQSVKLLGIPAGAKYTVTEAQEDYTPSISVTESVASTSGYTADVATNADGNGISDETTGIQGNTAAAFTNTREGTIPTGIFSNMGLSIIVIAVAAAGAAVSLIIIKKKKSEED